MSRRLSGRKFLLLGLSLILGSAGLPSFAAPTGAAEVNDKDLILLENRYFAHPYGHDPVEKRLERLECLIFGATKGGSNVERLTRLNKAVATRSQTPLPSVPATASASPTAPGGGGSTGKSNVQYPVLTTLEWRALKKTFPSESLDQRLDRLESKMFGQPSQTMAYIDRVDRLKKTLGIGSESVQGNEGLTARGPMPKARPRDEMGMDDGSSGGIGIQIGTPLQGMMPPVFNPFSSGTQLDTIFGATFDKMFQDMNRQMSEAQRLGPGNWVLDPETNTWIEMNTGRKANPKGGAINEAVPELRRPSGPGLHSSPNLHSIPNLRSNPMIPHIERRKNVIDLPPYADPNSI